MAATNKQMTSRERVLATARGLPADRTPVFLWINAHAGCKLMAGYRPARRALWNALARLFWKKFEQGATEAKEIWRLAPLLFDVHTFNWANAYSLELGADMVLASFATPWRYASFYRKDGRIMMKDIYGVHRALGCGIYPDMVEPAIKTIEDAESYRFPDPHDERLYSIFRRYRRDYPEACIAAEVWGTQDFTATSLFGMERFMIFLVDHPEKMKRFMDRWADFNLQVALNSLRAGADVVFIEDDYGYDNRPLISLEMWKEFTYPRLKKLIDAAHEAGAPAVLHSCGYQMPFLEHYVEAGLDMLHSFQPKAGNDFKKAYAEYGDRLTFITGIDIQRGESMTPAELKAEIIENYRIGRAKGRLVLGTSHEIQHTMPDENAAAIFETVRKIQAGVYD